MNTPRSAIARHNARQAHTHEARSRLEWAAEVHAILEAAATTFDETTVQQQITVPANRARGPVQARGILDMCQALGIAGMATSALTGNGDIALALAGHTDRMRAALHLAHSYLEAERLHLSRAHTDRPGVTLSPHQGAPQDLRDTPQCSSRSVRHYPCDPALQRAARSGRG